MDIEKKKESSIEEILSGFWSFIPEETRIRIIYSLDCVQENLREKTSVEGLPHSVSTTALEISNALGALLEWDKWAHEIPYIPFDADMCVKIIPPYMGAMVRFLVSRKGHTSGVSVYLDCHRVLGISPPSWEIFPVEGGAVRVDIQDVDGLLEKIRLGLKDTVEGD